MKIMIFTEGTIMMHKNAAGLFLFFNLFNNFFTRLSVKDYASYILIGNAVNKLKAWKKQGV